MRLNNIFNLLILSFLFVSCADEAPDYRQQWQRAHHLDEARMADFYGEPREDMNAAFGAVLEAVDGNWDKVRSLTEGSRPSDIFAYYHNLAMAMEGHLADSLMYYYQPFERGLFLPVDEKSGQLRIAASSEVWYRLGEMTMAEHSAMLAQLFSGFAGEAQNSVGHGNILIDGAVAAEINTGSTARSITAVPFAAVFAHTHKVVSAVARGEAAVFSI
jgi:hypothetical protein